MRTLTTAIALIVTLGLSGCGYHLRGSSPETALPESVRTAAIVAPVELANALRISLQARGLEVVDQPAAADLVVRGPDPTLSRRLLSVDGRDADAVEYELLLDVRYTVDRAGSPRLIEDGRALVQRDLLEDTRAITGKRSEEDVQRAEMTREAAERIVERIAASLR